MPDTTKTDDVTARRVRASLRARACAAAAATGAMVFAAGAGLLMPLALNAAWLAALPGAALSLLFAARAPQALRAHAQQAEEKRPAGRILAALLALTLLGGCVLLLAALASLAQQSLLPQAQTSFAMVCSLLGALLCALSGGAGVCRLAFALRWALPLLLLALTAGPAVTQQGAGLFPLLGMGPGPLLFSALCGLCAASPALMLLLPPPELTCEQLSACPPPGAGFFARRVACGALLGAAMLLALSLCAPYETLRGLSVWGARMRLTCAAAPGGGLSRTALVLTQTAALLVGAGALLSAGAQALSLALPALRERHAALAVCFGLCALALWGLACLGMRPLFAAAPFLIVPATIAAMGIGKH